jgi:DNA-binding response OmpR family regulator
LRTLKRWSGDDSAPLIFVTSKSDPAEVGEGLAAGGVADLAEPFRKPAALARIRIHLLNRRRIAPRNKNDRAQNRLLCMAAHDLRNPPVSIRALAHLLRNGTVGDVTLQQRDVLDPVYDASDALLEPVDDLLDVSVLEARELTLTLAPPSVTTLVCASVKLTNPTAADQGSSIVWRPGPLPEAPALDGPKVRQVLANLLDNAVNFSPPGSTITVETEWAASTAPSRSGTRVRESSTANASGSSRTSVARRPSPPAANRAPASASRSVTKSCRRAAGASAPTTDRRLAPRFASPLPCPYETPEPGPRRRRRGPHPQVRLAAAPVTRRTGRAPGRRGRAALDLSTLEKPDLVLLDIHRPHVDGTQALRKLKHVDSGCTALMLTSAFT